MREGKESESKGGGREGRRGILSERKDVREKEGGRGEETRSKEGTRYRKRRKKKRDSKKGKKRKGKTGSGDERGEDGMEEEVGEGR